MDQYHSISTAASAHVAAAQMSWHSGYVDQMLNLVWVCFITQMRRCLSFSFGVNIRFMQVEKCTLCHGKCFRWGVLVGPLPHVLCVSICNHKFLEGHAGDLFRANVWIILY